MTDYDTPEYVRRKQRVRDPTLSFDEAVELMKDTNDQIRWELAEYTTDPIVLDMLASDPSIDVRVHVARNEYTSIKTLDRLTNDPDGKFVRTTAKARLRSRLYKEHKKMCET